MTDLKDLYSLIAKVNPDRRLSRAELSALAETYGESGKEPTNDGVKPKVGLEMIAATAKRVEERRKKKK